LGRTWNFIFFPGWPSLAGFTLFCARIAGVFPWLSAPTKPTQWQNLLTGTRPPQEVFEELYRELKIIARSRIVVFATTLAVAHPAASGYSNDPAA
jgi:hypothetical protein